MFSYLSTQRAGFSWLFLYLASALLLPWHKTQSSPLGSALFLAMDEMPWLLPTLLAPFFSLLLIVKGRSFASTSLLLSLLLGLAYTLLQAFTISLHGPQFTEITNWFPTLEIQQTGLGWGGFAFLIGGFGLLSHCLAAKGLCKGDHFASAAIVFISVALLTFVFFPIAKLMMAAFISPDGSWGIRHMVPTLTSSELWQLNCVTGSGRCGVVINTLVLGFLSASISTLLGLALALLYVRSDFKYKGLLKSLSILPIITPPFVVGVAIIVLFGRSGLVTEFVFDLLDMRPTRWLYGLPGILIAQVLAFTPVTFLVIQGALEAINPTLEEASQTMGAKPLQSFRFVTLPLLKPGLAAAFLLAFIESLADFGNPIVVGGNFEVLSIKIFFAVVGAQYDLNNAAVLSLILLSLTLLAFWLQTKWLGKKSYVTVTGKSDAGSMMPLPNLVSKSALGITLPFIGLTLIIYAIITLGGFVQDIGRWDLTPSLAHLSTAFNIDVNENGLQFYGSAWDSLFTTLWVSALAAPVTAVLGIITAWLVTRMQFHGRRQFEFMTMLSFAIPGTVVGVSYVSAFNTPPVDITGTLVILVICFAFRNMPVGMRAGMAALSQIDKSMEEASLTMGATSDRTLKNVVLPLIKPAIFTALIYAFVTAMTAVSAVIFLVSARYNMATAYIMGRVENGEYALAITYSMVLMLIMIICVALITKGLGKRAKQRKTSVALTDMEVSQ